MKVTSYTYDKSSNWYGESQEGCEDWTLVLVTYGRCVYWIEEKKQVLEKGQWLLIPSSIPFYGRSVPTMLHEKYVVQFDPRAVQAHASFPLFKLSSATSRFTSKYELILDRLRHIHQQWQDKQPYYQTLCEALLTELFVYLHREWDQEAATSATLQLVEQMKSYIQNHYREHVSKEELGVCISRSPNYTATLFRKVTGQTISEYVHAARIKTAVYMLRHSALTVTEISDFIGYNDPSYFYRVFKRLTGLVPTDLVSDRENVRK
ncbi:MULTISPECIES: AraC family transcriptional regulator [Paenibacillus]|uniref:AraC family transcriptional regulator n=1 Tax=Paenibacillus violae TaxID=3077234 RepID=A0ABU3RLU8_9BACL|nr:MULTISPECIES: AraC family transcriptional regulator [Paenibacillus]MDU0205098.1 AraC family transcriptional regulator [Paenibacillus sp. PFR10]MEC0268816.1 AraC family transcriptional regulator [Paenibacillus anseongense]